MAQFDVYETAHGDLVVDCQSEVWANYNTRMVAPLITPDDDLPRVERLNPIFQVDGQPRIMMTEFAASIPVRELTTKIVSLADHELTIKSAIDMLVQGH